MVKRQRTNEALAVLFIVLVLLGLIAVRSWQGSTPREHLRTDLLNHDISSDTLSLNRAGIHVTNAAIPPMSPGLSDPAYEPYAENGYYIVTLSNPKDRAHIKEQLADLKARYPAVPENETVLKAGDIPFVTFGAIEQDVYIEDTSLGRSDEEWVYILAYNDYANIYIQVKRWVR